MCSSLCPPVVVSVPLASVAQLRRKGGPNSPSPSPFSSPGAERCLSTENPAPACYLTCLRRRVQRLLSPRLSIQSAHATPFHWRKLHAAQSSHQAAASSTASGELLVIVRPRQASNNDNHRPQHLPHNLPLAHQLTTPNYTTPNHTPPKRGNRKPEAATPQQPRIIL
ncbi:hypothetical protein CALCODRAFT_268521 [Calocera cornea HHB12733]|uniref:Uncharacterized protein n=1 Tax=Calocera cornea HHB12733 TaxID=1353952 RepID=A0A165GBN8_9BASI|nr:hypothetical protein CALCODRAFT_268521 [Calocera cornea HHB12733]